MFFEIAVYVLIGILFLVYYYKIRNKQFKETEREHIKQDMEDRFKCGLQPSDFVKTLLICFTLSLVSILTFVLYLSKHIESSVYFDISVIDNPILSSFFIAFWIGFIVLMFFYVRRTYRNNITEYKSYLIYECFIWGRTLPKKRYAEITTNKIKRYSKTEGKIVTAFTALIVIVSSAFFIGFVGDMSNFGKDVITVCYSDYNYSDIKEIYISSKYKPLVGDVQYGEYVTVVFNNGYQWNDRNKKKLSIENIEIISGKSGVKPIECDILPDDLN